MAKSKKPKKDMTVLALIRQNKPRGRFMMGVTFQHGTELYVFGKEDHAVTLRTLGKHACAERITWYTAAVLAQIVRTFCFDEPKESFHETPRLSRRRRD